MSENTVYMIPLSGEYKISLFYRQYLQFFRKCRLKNFKIADILNKIQFSKDILCYYNSNAKIIAQ